MLSYWTKLISGKPDKLSCVVYKLLHNMYITGDYKSPWICKVKQTLDSLGLSYIWQNQFVDNIDIFKSDIKRIAKLQFEQEWQATVNNSDKCITYRIVKTEFQLENYLLNIPVNCRPIITKFRLRNHKLPIEKGIYNDTPRNERICLLCNSTEIGDEFHYLFKCSVMNDKRKMLLKRCYYNKPNILKFKELFCTTNKPTLLKLTKFAKYIMQTFKD